MNVILLIIIGLIVLVIGFNLWWRRAVRYRSLPCPPWLFRLLYNHYTEAIACRLPSLDKLSLSRGMRVLDVGCGPGRLSIPVAKRIGPNGELVALDIQPAMLRMLEKKIIASGLTNIRTVLGGIDKIEIEHNSFDRVLLTTVLGEIPEREIALREIYKALKPGGILSVTEIFFDPHYQTRNTVYRLAEAVGFYLDCQHGNWLAFTMNFIKPPGIKKYG